MARTLLLVMFHNIREVAMSNTRSRTRQLTMVFIDAGLWEQIPEKSRLECRALLIQLLSEVVHGEGTEEERSDNDREDTTGTP